MMSARRAAGIAASRHVLQTPGGRARGRAALGCSSEGHTLMSTGRDSRQAGAVRRAAERSWQLAATGLPLAAPLAAQCTTQSLSPTSLDVRCVAAPTADRVFVATDDDS